MNGTMAKTWSDVQKRRLRELDAGSKVLSREFSALDERDNAFREIEKDLVRQGRRQLEQLRSIHLRPALCRLESTLVDTLNGSGFVQVSSPIIMSRGVLAKMGIDAGHPLNSQVFRLDDRRCLRPMLAPHLYYLLTDLLRLWEHPVRIFESGPCFRKETQGAQHAAEFTMLNLVEMGLPGAACRERLEELAGLVTRAAGLTGFSLQTEASVVYGQTIDVLAGKEPIEVGSAALGPHPLDRPWKISVPWVGIGFGLERLLMARDGGENLSRYGRSLSYLDGVRLNI